MLLMEYKLQITSLHTQDLSVVLATLQREKRASQKNRCKDDRKKAFVRSNQSLQTRDAVKINTLVGLEAGSTGGGAGGVDVVTTVGPEAGSCKAASPTVVVAVPLVLGAIDLF